AVAARERDGARVAAKQYVVAEEERSPALRLVDPLGLPAAEDPIRDAAPRGAPAPALTEGQLPDSGDDQAGLDVVVVEPLVVHGVGGVEKVRLPQPARIGVAREERVAGVEALLCAKLGRVEITRGVVALPGHAGELREGPKELRARRRRSVQALARNEVLERIGDVRREEVDRRLIALGTGRQVLPGDRVEIVIDRKI